MKRLALAIGIVAAILCASATEAVSTPVLVTLALVAVAGLWLGGAFEGDAL